MTAARCARGREDALYPRVGTQAACNVDKAGTARTTRSGTIHVTYSWSIITDAARSALDGTFTGKPFEDASVIVPREPKGSCTHANV